MEKIYGKFAPKGQQPIRKHRVVFTSTKGLKLLTSQLPMIQIIKLRLRNMVFHINRFMHGLGSLKNMVV